MKEFEDLEIWRDARALTSFLYGATRGAAFARDPVVDTFARYTLPVGLTW